MAYICAYEFENPHLRQVTVLLFIFSCNFYLVLVFPGRLLFVEAYSRLFYQDNTNLSLGFPRRKRRLDTRKIDALYFVRFRSRLQTGHFDVVVKTWQDDEYWNKKEVS